MITNILISICEYKSGESWLQFFLVMFYLFPPCIDSEEKQVQLITTLDNTEVDLLTLEYIKVHVISYVKIDSSVCSSSKIVSILNDYFVNGGKWLSH